MEFIDKFISHIMESKLKPGQDYHQNFSDESPRFLFCQLIDELELDEEKNVHQFLKTLFENDNKQIFLALDKIEKSTVQARQELIIEGLENAPKLPTNHSIRRAFDLGFMRSANLIASLGKIFQKSHMESTLQTLKSALGGHLSDTTLNSIHKAATELAYLEETDIGLIDQGILDKMIQNCYIEASIKNLKGRYAMHSP
ncbi:hypothetical protein PGTUg99_020281 [Puccinia graminis f. sp. tritici]|uniref:Uncharacterized protein n=1 Tax=Puccinia graminis f. sp. tritici TaxID=56615 RepID=A0A5B0RKB9_PUCGR|nr:hypothetical protein PGTUg99_020281 [Puccinia graminis f. sp. tritici]